MSMPNRYFEVLVRSMACIHAIRVGLHVKLYEGHDSAIRLESLSYMFVFWIVITIASRNYVGQVGKASS